MSHDFKHLQDLYMFITHRDIEVMLLICIKYVVYTNDTMKSSKISK